MYLPGAKEKTHYYPMAMATHNIFPPPTSVGGAFGEERRVQYTHLGIAIGDEIEEKAIEDLTKPQLKALRVERCKVQVCVCAFEFVFVCACVFLYLFPRL